ncbi:MAG TPA: hypothetical protein VF103_09085, partial [Polyangiaceae bacterium]
ALETLRGEETDLRARTDFETLPPSSRSFGSNPYAIVALQASTERPSAPRYAATLRGDSGLVLLDERGSEMARVSTPPSPNALAALPDGRLFVTGDIDASVLRYRIQGHRLVPDGEIPIPGAASLRAVAADERAVFVADFWGDRLTAISLDGTPNAPLRTEPLAGGPVRLALTDRYLAAACLFEHSIAIFERDPDGVGTTEIKRLSHDGPIFGLSLLERPHELFIAAGGVEDHPLDRRDKAFGYVDSFVYLYRLDAQKHLERMFSLNTSELGVVTPKVVRLVDAGDELRVTVVGYASEDFIELAWKEGVAEPRLVATKKGLPGCSDVAFSGERRLCANPLFDAWVELESDGPGVHVERERGPRDPSSRERLGEALFFTTLMAPDVTSAGRRSRFTCETCHFEGATDGRVHNSGRNSIRVSTRPLLGLFNDAPHFSRAHDRDLTSVSHNEFSVANRGNPVDPWFSLSRARFPWLSALGVQEESVAPLELRRALLVFLARFSHAENPLAVRREVPRRFTESERRGAEIFRERCVRCHAARLVARDATKEVPFERWEELVLSPEGPIVWSNGEYAKTGVTPYVDPMGTRTPSLRRLYLKRPYLTNGSAPTLDALVMRARYSETELLHLERPEREGELRTFAPDEVQALVAFLRVL